jgi:hypothetical protein
LTRRSEVEADPDAPAGAASFITRTAVRVGLHAAHAVPGIGAWRVVSEDVLGVLTSGRGLDNTARGQLLDWLRSLPFVTRDAGRCVYHDVVRTAMIRLERSQSPGTGD